MPRLKESLRAAGSHISENLQQSFGIDLIADRISSKGLNETKARINQEEGVQKIVPVAKLVASLGIAAVGFVAPNTVRGFASATQREEIKATRGTPEDWHFQKDYAAALLGLAADFWSVEKVICAFEDPSVETVVGALALKLLYNSASHALLDIAGVSPLPKSLNGLRA